MNIEDHRRLFGNPELSAIAEKILRGERISEDDALILYQQGDPGGLAYLAGIVKKRKHGEKVYFIKNMHLEPTNICIYQCLFCAYSRKKGETDAWEYSLETMLDMVRTAPDDIAEIHITGGTHPDRTLSDYAQLLRQIREIRPDVHLKAYSAAELFYVFSRAGVTAEDGIRLLKDAGLDALPGGGAEIFDPVIRQKIAPGKASAADWLSIHRAAHRNGIHSGSTMLYGHIESYEHRVSHMAALRKLQDETAGFTSFIPLKYRKANNKLGISEETSLTEDLRNYTVSRLFLDNIPHIKTYWPMLGRDHAALSLHFGADDIDGTIEDTTRIYTMAGSSESRPQMSREQMTELIRNEGFEAIERKAKTAIT